MDTLALSPAWDLYLDQYGNIAVISGDAQILQDVCSACRLFLGEFIYDTTQGIDYFDEVLGQRQPTAYLIDQLIEQAKTIDGVLSASVTITGIQGRQLTGTINITTATSTLTASLS